MQLALGCMHLVLGCVLLVLGCVYLALGCVQHVKNLDSVTLYLYIFVTFDILSLLKFCHFRRFVFRHFVTFHVLTFNIFSFNVLSFNFLYVYLFCCILWSVYVLKGGRGLAPLPFNSLDEYFFQNATHCVQFVPRKYFFVS